MFVRLGYPVFASNSDQMLSSAHRCYGSSPFSSMYTRRSAIPR